MAGQANGTTTDQHAEETPQCGIIMPISTTSNHPAEHWAGVLGLLRRAVEKASMEPKEVWIGASTDKITTRILNQLFTVPIAICDISDLNANVMLELGMRLSSKKPTIVVVDDKGVIPFDINDFQALIYPHDLNMPRMEQFLEALTTQLTEKHAAHLAGTYQPFLADVSAFEVLEPEAKEVPFQKLVSNQLDAILARMERLESRTRIAASPNPSDMTYSTTYLVVPTSHAEQALRRLTAISVPVSIEEWGEVDGDYAFAIKHANDGISPKEVGTVLRGLAQEFGGTRGLPPKFQIGLDGGPSSAANRPVRVRKRAIF